MILVVPLMDSTRAAMRIGEVVAVADAGYVYLLADLQGLAGVGVVVDASWILDIPPSLRRIITPLHELEDGADLIDR